MGNNDVHRNCGDVPRTDARAMAIHCLFVGVTEWMKLSPQEITTDQRLLLAILLEYWEIIIINIEEWRSMKCLWILISSTLYIDQDSWTTSDCLHAISVLLLYIFIMFARWLCHYARSANFVHAIIFSAVEQLTINNNVVEQKKKIKMISVFNQHIPVHVYEAWSDGCFARYVLCKKTFVQRFTRVNVIGIFCRPAFATWECVLLNVT